MKKRAKKLSKAKIWAIVSASIVTFFAVVIIVTNVFIPVKYLPGYCVSDKRAPLGVMRVTFVDVGYGDCIIVELPDGKNMLIDAGNGRYSNNLKVLKELNRRNIGTIDYLVCTSVNSEHCGGLSDVLKYKKVKTVYMPYCTNKYITDAFRSFSDMTNKSGAKIVFNEFKAGETGDEYFFTFLSPSKISDDEGEYAELNKHPSSTTRNNSSAVLWLEYADTAILLTGDVQTSILEFIASSYKMDSENYPVKLENCKIVQLACHGAEVSACADFYGILNPETAVISVGKNGIGCPSNQAMTDIINFVGQNYFRTDEHGNIVIEVTDYGYTVK